MINLNSINIARNLFDFDITLSSGDKISMSLRDDQKSELSFSEEGKSKRFSMSLIHEFGYKITYQGDGIDKQDEKEIQKAMKLIKPIFDKFVKNIKKNSVLPDDKEMIKWVNLAKKDLPKFDNPNSIDKLKYETAKNMDNILSVFERDSKVMEGAKKFFDKLFDNSKKFLYYA